jgi:CubicO group peptidase (beta-lactamase class C family)
MPSHTGKALLLSSLLPAIGIAQTLSDRENDATVKAYAAGYKAGFVCSATFNGGKSLPQIERHELTGIYPLVADLLAEMPMRIDREAQRVSVTWDADMPPRISQWRPYLGCVDLPVGADTTVVAQLPRIALEQAPEAAREDDGRPWSRRAGVNASSGNAALDAVIEKAFSDDFGGDGRTTAVLVATPDAILAERYAPDYSPVTSQRTWSVAKSIAASVVGAAVHQGLLDVSDPAGIPTWSRAADPRGAITVEHLLHMASGLDSNVAGNRTDRVYLGGGLVRDNAATTSLEAVPGTRWKYANNDTMLAVHALRQHFASRDAFLRFPFEALLHRIGMTHTFLETDWDGDFVLSSQVWTTSRDLARLGLLHLADGVWEGQRLLPEGWVDYVATPAPAQPPREGEDGTPRPGYGAQWWLYDNFPGLPADTFAARGNRGQYLMVLPSRNLVIVRRGYDMAGGDYFRLEDFAAEVLAALE